MSVYDKILGVVPPMIGSGDTPPDDGAPGAPPSAEVSAAKLSARRIAGANGHRSFALRSTARPALNG